MYCVIIQIFKSPTSMIIRCVKQMQLWIQLSISGGLLSMIFVVVKMHSVFYSNCVKMFDKHFPITEIKSRYNNKLQRLTTASNLSIKNTNKLCVKYKDHKTYFNEMQYTTYQVCRFILPKIKLVSVWNIEFYQVKQYKCQVVWLSGKIL